ncbi:MAG: glycosyltransferase [Flexibacter sp. CG_4_10_14_3_um_filter_32_15]|nr:MAG: glycosyltransferase [Flexibacter sp. CG_4_10_14_3_um_filter_32_15]
MQPLISIVSPVYRAEKIVDKLVEQISEEVSKITDNFEIILVEDGSPDNSWEAIERNCQKDKRVKGIKLSRNFGQHYAITAGLEYSQGEWVVVMDCDLQDDPIYISQLFEKAQQGFDIVYTVKKKREHSFFKNFFANLYNHVFNWLIDNKEQKSSNQIGSYSLLSRKVVEAFKNYKDYRRHYLMILRWLGFSNTFIQIEHRERFEGKSSYNFSKLLTHALDGITSQSDKILRLTVTLGFVLSVLSILGGIYIIIRTFISSFQSGWASLVVLILFTSGLIITSIGISAIYIGKIFEQTKERPLFIIDKTINS